MDRLNIAIRICDRAPPSSWTGWFLSPTDLIEREMAYTTDDGVYFDVDKLAEYGALVNRTVDDLRCEVDVDEGKDDPLDFALWKAAKPVNQPGNLPVRDARAGISNV